eukprot:3961765-Pleurochrysis_carterae.AAC.1
MESTPAFLSADEVELGNPKGVSHCGECVRNFSLEICLSANAPDGNKTLQAISQQQAHALITRAKPSRRHVAGAKEGEKGDLSSGS